MEFDFIKNPAVIIAILFVIAFIFISNKNQSSGTIQRVGSTEELEKEVLNYEIQKAGLMSDLYKSLTQLNFDREQNEKQRNFELQSLQLQLQSAKETAQIESNLESQRIANEYRMAQLQDSLQRYYIKKSKGRSSLDYLFANLPDFIRLGGSLFGRNLNVGNFPSTPPFFPR
jgi:hypothetical protein